MIIISIIFVSLLAIGVVLVAYGTFAKTRWAMNLNAVSCPRCNMQLPTLRKPLSLSQTMWGGQTCPGCGTEVDKWGREVSSIDEIQRGRSDSR
jgi:hypothetical protein